MTAQIRMPGKRSKYGAKRTTYNGVSYASKAEAQRAMWLDMEVKAGNIRWWLPQPTFRLGCLENIYRADFLIVGMNGQVYVEDVKGHETAKFKRDMKLWKQYGPCSLYVVNGNHHKQITGGAAK